MEVVLNMASPTIGDRNFYGRWEEVGKVYTTLEDIDPENVTVLVVDHYTILGPGIRDFYPNLKCIASANTGHTHLKHVKDIPILSLRGETEFLKGIHSVSEFTLYLMLILAKEPAIYGFGTGSLLKGKTLGIIGLGRIGTHVKKLAEGFGMNVLTYDQGDTVFKLRRLIKDSDFVSIHLSETKKTQGFFKKSYFDLMKPTAYLINTSRASIIDETALEDALLTNKIAGAALDVRNRIPSHIPNLVVTGHVAGNTLEDRIRTDEFMVEKTKKFLRGLTPKRSKKPVSNLSLLQKLFVSRELES